MLTFYSQNVWNSNPCHFRTPIVRSLVSDFNADICMFQEFGPFSVRKGDKPLQNLMSDEYTEICPYISHKNYTPVFYKTDCFDLIDDGYLLYDGLNDADSKSVSWCVLKDKRNGVMFAVASTHFWWMFDNEEDFAQRLANVDQLRAVCDGIIAKHNVPVIIGGDFNNGAFSEQGEEPYKKMLSLGFRDMRLVSEKTTDCLTHHEYPVEMPDGTFTKGEMPERNLDNIFIYGDFDVKALSFDVITSDKALTSSDHCPLIGCIEF